jgi:hypothetical protein
MKLKILMPQRCRISNSQQMGKWSDITLKSCGLFLINFLAESLFARTHQVHHRWAGNQLSSVIISRQGIWLERQFTLQYSQIHQVFSDRLMFF